MKLEDTSAIVTGAGSGIGEATSLLLAERGSFVIAFDRDLQSAQRTAARAHGLAAGGDVTSTEDLSAAVGLAGTQGSLRVLVNAAGIARTGRIVGRTLNLADAYPLAEFEQLIAVNLTGTFNAMRVVATAMAAQDPADEGQRGVIVNIASLAGLEGQIGQAAYAASKGGVLALTLPAARELARHGIRVNAVAPGATNTPLLGTDDYRAHLAGQALFPPRLARPEEVAELVLASIENDYINAATLRIDAGARLPPK